MKLESDIGKQIKQRMDNGLIVPSQITVSLLKKAMEVNGWQKTYLIDGFPRNQENFEVWEQNMQSIVNFRYLLFFECSIVSIQNLIFRKI